MNEMTIITRQEPGIASIDNFEELKAYLQVNLSRYKNIVYSEDNLKAAKNDMKQLSGLKRKLEEKRKEIKKIYMAPYQQIEAQLKELTALIDEPLEEIDAFVKQMEMSEKQQQRLTIRGFYDDVSAPMGELAEALFESPAFLDSKWENKCTSVKMWQDAIQEKIKLASQGVRTIQSAGGKHTAALIARFLETLDITGTIQYKKTLEAAEQLASVQVEQVDDEDQVVGYKVLKVNGTRRQLTQLLEQMKLIGID